MISSFAIKELNLDYLPLLIAVYILWTSWRPKLEIAERPRADFAVFGFVRTGLSMIVGATGPLGHSLLLRKGLDLHALVVTTALLN